MKHCFFIFLRVFLVAGLVAVFASCSSDTSPETAGAQSGTTSQNDIEDATQYALAAMDDNAGDSQDIKQLYDVNNTLGADDDTAAAHSRLQQDKRQAAVNTLCGTFSQDLQKQAYTMEFNGSCNNLTGSITWSTSGLAGNKVYSMEFSSVSDGECTIDGSVEMQSRYEGSQVSVSYSMNNMNICGNQYDGTASIGVDRDTGEITYVLDTKNYEYRSGTILVDTDIDYNAETGISGFATVTINGSKYDCTAADIIIDKTCGAPTSGTLTLTGANGNIVVMDFTNTTCENQTVEYTLNGKTQTMDLGELAEMILSAT